jgi:hypothetical protein
MKDKDLLSAILTENTPSTNYAQKWVENKNAIKIHQNYIKQFHYKENVFAEPWKVAL